jgi:dihydrofolate reductase
MGRRTWQSIGRPLPGRRNIVVTRNTEFKAEGCEVVHSLKQGLELSGEAEKVFIIGGEQLYRLGLEPAETLILTVLDHEMTGDVFFPKFSCPPFVLTHTERINGSLSYSIQTFHRL